MNDYKKVAFCVSPMDEAQCDILAALLGEKGYESFEQEPTGINAYVSNELFDEGAITEALDEFEFSSKITWRIENIEGKDWNEEWEKNYFTPMVIGDACVIHSSFHKGFPRLKYDIVIDPKMAFGTGHHETTSLMAEQILRENMKGKSVLDMGTGTGILAILASMHGAEKVVGIEIDEFAYKNAEENIRLNKTSNVAVRHGDASTLKEEKELFDYVLANINRNIITADIDKYAEVLRTGGKMQLSGFYVQDIPVIENVAKGCGLEPISYNEKKNWAMLMLTKK